MSLDLDMLLLWLVRQNRPLSLQEIFCAWEPTWTVDEIEAMLRDLRQQRAVQVEGHRTTRYRAQRANQSEVCN